MDFSLNEEQVLIKKAAHDLADKEFKPRAAEVDWKEEFPYDNVRKLVQAGFMGMTIPQEYGGGSKSVLDTILVVEEVARACATTARIVVEGNTGAVGAIIHYGSEEQKQRYLPLVCQGEKPCIAITEPEAGSAATDLKARAANSGREYIVNGSKCFITGAGVSNIYLVLVRFSGSSGAEGIGGVIIEKGTPGFRFGKIEPMMGIRGLPEGELIFEDCRISGKNVLATEGGFKKLMSAYNGQRVGASAVALGVAQGAYEEALAYSQRRRQFGRELADFQGIQWMLADMAINLAAARLLIYQAAANAGTGFPNMLEAAIAKTFASEMAIQVTNAALQVHGAYGYSRNFPLERMARDARMFTIGGGTVEMQRNVIAGQILQRKISQR